MSTQWIIQSDHPIHASDATRAMSAMRIAYYFEPLASPVGRNIERDDLPGLIDLHERTFRSHGWEPVRLNEQVSRKHPLYSLFSSRDTILSRSRNDWLYTRACYMRWLAYAVEGIPFCDFDVLNYGFTPDDAAALMAEAKGPLLLSVAGAVGLLRSSDYESVINLFVEFVQKPVIKGRLASEDINDMTILRELRPEWFTQVPFEDRRYAKDHTAEGWRDAKLVHYPYHYTPVPRVRTAAEVRPPEEMATGRAIAKELSRLGCRSVLDLSCDDGKLASDLFMYGYAGTILSVAAPAEKRKGVGNILDRNTSWMMWPMPSGWSQHNGAHAPSEKIIDILGDRGLAESARSTFDAVVVGSEVSTPADLDQRLGALPSLKLIAFVGGNETPKDPVGTCDPPHLAEPEFRDGLRQVSAEPAAGIQFYERHADVHAISVRNEPLSLGSVVTSLGATPKRISATNKDYGEIWFRHCANSWKMTAPVVRSVSEMAPPLPWIEWTRVDGQPTITELFAKMAPEGEKSVLLVNADILVSPSLRESQSSLRRDVIYYGSRVDVEVQKGSEDVFDGLGYYKGGFDYFILPPHFIRSVNVNRSLPDFLRIGEPWWDCAVPILALASGFPIKRLTLKNPAAFHLRHPTERNQHQQQTGIKFIAWLKALDASRLPALSGILPYILLDENLVDEVNGFPRLAKAIRRYMP